MTEKEPFIRIESLSKSFHEHTGLFSTGQKKAVLNDLNLTLQSGLSYGLVGQSGCGKTTLARLLMGLTKPSNGGIFYEGVNLNKISKAAYYRKVQMIFQNPYLSLDPHWRVEKIIAEGMRGTDSSERAQKCADLMKQVGLDKGLLTRRPRHLSGGERQRIAIARALAVEPDFLILDEPTSQLDVSVQARMIELFQELKPKLKYGYLFVSHDLALLSHLADIIIVMRDGQVEEIAPAQQIIRQPRSEFTKKLLDSIPVWRKQDNL